MLPTALIPARISPTAKRRLAHVLGPNDRMQLVRTLLEHVTSVIARTAMPIVVLSPTPIDAIDDVQVWHDERPGLNAAVHAAIDRIGSPTFVIHADLPQLAVADVDQVLETPGDVVIARARDGGTNGLLLRRAIAPAFGPGSALVHAARARAAGLSASLLDIPGFALDVDDEAGLSACGAAYVPGMRP